MVTNQLEDFYCDEVLSGNTPVKAVLETENVLAFYHTRPFYEALSVNFVALFKLSKNRF